jgi:hypothetical protein
MLPSDPGQKASTCVQAHTAVPHNSCIMVDFPEVFAQCPAARPRGRFGRAVACASRRVTTIYRRRPGIAQRRARPIRRPATHDVVNSCPESTWWDQNAKVAEDGRPG